MSVKHTKNKLRDFITTGPVWAIPNDRDPGSAISDSHVIAFTGPARLTEQPRATTFAPNLGMAPKQARAFRAGLLHSYY